MELAIVNEIQEFPPGWFVNDPDDLIEMISSQENVEPNIAPKKSPNSDKPQRPKELASQVSYGGYKYNHNQGGPNLAKGTFTGFYRCSANRGKNVCKGTMKIILQADKTLQFFEGKPHSCVNVLPIGLDKIADLREAMTLYCQDNELSIDVYKIKYSPTISAVQYILCY
jgi:hypothetical protein